MEPPELIDADRAVADVDVESRRTVLVPFETVEELAAGAAPPTAGADLCGVRPVGAIPQVSQYPPSAIVPSQPGRSHLPSERGASVEVIGAGVG
jgi:hypothetical protein